MALYFKDTTSYSFKDTTAYNWKSKADEVSRYIKNMFSYERPEWDSSYEGVMLFDLTENLWVCGDNQGWIEIKEDIL